MPVIQAKKSLQPKTQKHVSFALTVFECENEGAKENEA